jgi:signal transduction histidine kinase
MACALWVGAYTQDVRQVAYVMPPLVLVGIALQARWPVVGGWLLVAGCALSATMGVDEQSAAWLLPLLVTIYVAGRYAASAGASVAVGYWVVLLAPDPTVPNAVFGVVLFGGPWYFGRLVRGRARAARIAGAEQARVEGEDEEAVVNAVVAQERARLSAETIEVVRTAVADMRERAGAARTTLDRGLLVEIGDRGRAAVTDLRRLLGLLRAQSSDHPPTVSVASGAPAWRADVVAVLVVVGLTLLDPLIEGGWRPPLLELLFCVPVALRRREPVAALLAAAFLSAACAVTGAEPMQGFGAIAAVVLLSWSVGAGKSPLVWASGAAFAAATVWLWVSVDPDNLEISLVWLGGSAFVAWAWSERQREFDRARSETAAVLERRDQAIARAVTEERLRIARELHDVTSHAVGVMVTQAGAAAALAPTNPVRARAALEVMDSAGRQALVELDLLGQVLDVSAPQVGSLGEALAELAGRMRATGTDVGLRLSALPVDGRLEAVVHRTVQEALTNAVRHAPGAVVEVAVEEVDGDYVVSVCNGPPSRTSTSDSAGSGFGLVGLAERVRALGGDVSAGPVDDGGFLVRAVLPRRTTEVAT